MRKETTRSDSFVVRIWREKCTPGWKGWVQHARSGESAFVQTVDELLTFVERQTGKLNGARRRGLK